MMPQVVRLQVCQPNRRTIRLWVPVLPVLILLSPLVLLLSPLVLLAAAVAWVIWRVDLIRTLVAAGRVLCALKGIHIEVDQPDTRVLVDIR